MMQAHYRSILDFSSDAIEASEKGYNKLMEAINSLGKIEAGNTSDFDVNEWSDKCYEALNDDFNTPILIAELFSAVKFINQVKDNKASVTPEDLEFLTDKINAFVFDILGLTNDAVSNDNTNTLSDTVEVLIKLRAEARANKNFALSDKIRDELLAVGIQLKDGKDGTSFTTN
jgi:cysteinyl-tRNA synthetase